MPSSARGSLPVYASKNAPLLLSKITPHGVFSVFILLKINESLKLKNKTTPKRRIGRAFYRYKILVVSISKKHRYLTLKMTPE
jgi:hypothetical protein